MLDGVQKSLLVHRKGSTRAFPPHHPLIPVDYQVSVIKVPWSVGGYLSSSDTSIKRSQTLKWVLFCLFLLLKTSIKRTPGWIYNAALDYVLERVDKEKFDVHTDPIFKELKILKLDDIYLFHLGKFMYLFQNNLLPRPFSNLILRTNQVHNYNTRSSNQNLFYVPFCRTNLRQFCVHCQGPSFFNTLNWTPTFEMLFLFLSLRLFWKNIFFHVFNTLLSFFVIVIVFYFVVQLVCGIYCFFRTVPTMLLLFT